ncbi:patatin-like phospholipase family protein [Nocardia yamanashiensis]|uniref:patatin-like phospholipase family protein n=1 Tax=Nocardia yamanashiensis TaxID=209247 RepID=UPI001E32CF5F|nr:patatin-like phospholipase family protein [Nocardia yamanashiensis]UGT44238.1 patatin-like phospholipase family protein [Nocardia yamanashiensis]
MSDTFSATPGTAFVLGGGGLLGGYQVGMLRALDEHGITPDLVIGTSVGSIQGAILATYGSRDAIDALTDFWHEALTRKVMGVPVRALLSNLVRLRPALATQDALRSVLERHVGAHTLIEDLDIAFQCVAASIERSTARYFDHGPLIPALLASSCIPGLWPPIAIGEEHYIDGGVVETVPLTRAVSYGATDIYVLRLRQRELPLRAPRLPWQLGQTVFEVSRRHRLGQVINMRPTGVTVHLLPTGEDLLEPPDTGLYTTVTEQLEVFERRVTAGYRSTIDYLEAPADRKTATIRSRTRTRSSADHTIRFAPHRPPLASDFVRAKLAKFFELLDTDRDGRIDAADYSAVADRVCLAFGHPVDSHTGRRLRTTFADLWTGLCRTAGVTLETPMTADDFVHALGALSTNPAAYDATVLPAVAAILTAADHDRDSVLNTVELATLLTAFGVGRDEIGTAALRLDTNNDGVLSFDELDEAFRDYFTTDEPGAAGNLLFGRLEPGSVH